MNTFRHFILQHDILRGIVFAFVWPVAQIILGVELAFGKIFSNSFFATRELPLGRPSLCIGLWAFTLLLLSSCSPFIDTKQGIVSAGFLSSTQAFSGKMKCSDGSTASWSVVGTDGTSVANNAVTTLGSAALANSAFKTVDSNNKLSATKDTNALKSHVSDNKTSVLKQDITRKSANDPALIQTTGGKAKAAAAAAPATTP